MERPAFRSPHECHPHVASPKAAKSESSPSTVPTRGIRQPARCPRSPGSASDEYVSPRRLRPPERPGGDGQALSSAEPYLAWEGTGRKASRRGGMVRKTGMNNPPAKNRLQRVIRYASRRRTRVLAGLGGSAAINFGTRLALYTYRCINHNTQPGPSSGRPEEVGHEICGEGEYFEVGASDESVLTALLLRRERIKWGLSLAEVVRKLGSRSLNTYARYEQGRSVPTVPKLSQLLAAVASRKDFVLTESQA